MNPVDGQIAPELHLVRRVSAHAQAIARIRLSGIVNDEFDGPAIVSAIRYTPSALMKRAEGTQRIADRLRGSLPLFVTHRTNPSHDIKGEQKAIAAEVDSLQFAHDTLNEIVNQSLQGKHHSAVWGRSIELNHELQAHLTNAIREARRTDARVTENGHTVKDSAGVILLEHARDSLHISNWHTRMPTTSPRKFADNFAIPVVNQFVAEAQAEIQEMKVQAQTLDAELAKVDELVPKYKAMDDADSWTSELRAAATEIRSVWRVAMDAPQMTDDQVDQLIDHEAEFAAQAFAQGGVSKERLFGVIIMAGERGPAATAQATPGLEATL